MSKPARILWAEDSIGDVLLIKEAFRQAGISFRLNVVNNGIVAMDFLLRRGRFTRSRRPDLIILDLNMPKKNGREVIHDIKADPLLLDIPLVVLTSSNADRDAIDGLDPFIISCYRCPAGNPVGCAGVNFRTFLVNHDKL
jgi:CheY-like chemotaxis protein